MTRTTKKTVKLDSGSFSTADLPSKGTIVVLQGAPSDIGVHLVLEKPTVIGRGPGADLVLLDPHLSRRHCEIVPKDDGVWLNDLGSKNGTLLNGIRMTGSKQLHDGDHIFIAETVLKFSAADSLEASYHASMDERVGTDELTGLVARHRFEGGLVRALEAAAASKTPVGVMMLDLDGIKQINDAHGHLFGAFAIAEAGKVIGSVIAAHGVASRLGGDEFAVFLPRRTKKITLDLARVILLDMQRHVFEKDGVSVRPTISIGVAVFPDDGKTPADLMHAADGALYRAKNSGRNRVETT